MNGIAAKAALAGDAPSFRGAVAAMAMEGAAVAAATRALRVKVMGVSVRSDFGGVAPSAKPIAARPHYLFVLTLRAARP